MRFRPVISLISYFRRLQRCVTWYVFFKTPLRACRSIWRKSWINPPVSYMYEQIVHMICIPVVYFHTVYRYVQGDEVNSRPHLEIVLGWWKFIFNSSYMYKQYVSLCHIQSKIDRRKFLKKILIVEISNLNLKIWPLENQKNNCSIESKKAG